MHEKELPEFPFTNRFVFNRVLKNDPEIAVQILKLAAVGYVTKEELNDLVIIDEANKEVRLDSKTSRLDIYMGNDRLRTDTEMNSRYVRFLIKRTRYYLSVDDVDSLKKRESYDKLKKSIIIMILTYDSFGLGKQMYIAEERLFAGNMDITVESQYDAQYVKIYLNASAWDDDTELGRFLKYVKTNVASDAFTEEIHHGVEEVNRTDRGDIMTVEDEINELKLEAKIEGREEGRKEGRAEGLAEGKAEGHREGMAQAEKNARSELERIIRNLLNANTPRNIIAAATGLSLTEIDRIANQ